MAIVNNSTFKVAYVSTLQKYQDIASKDSATLYWVAGAKKVYLDGVAYGFDESDITATRLAALILGTGGAEVNTSDRTVVVSVTPSAGTLSISADVRLAGTLDSENLLEVLTGDERGQGGLVLQASVIQDMIDSTLTLEVLNRLGEASGIATLDTAGKVPSSQLPSYVDDVVEYANQAAFPTSGVSGIIYVAQDTNKVYRWGGSGYIEISSSLALGETSASAYRGDRGKSAYDHISTTNNPHGVTKSQVGLGSVENYGIATQAEAQAGTSNAKYMTPARTKEAITALAAQLKWTVIT